MRSAPDGRLRRLVCLRSVTAGLLCATLAVLAAPTTRSMAAPSQAGTLPLAACGGTNTENRISQSLTLERCL